MLLVDRIPCCRFSDIYTVTSEQMNLKNKKQNITTKIYIFDATLVKGKVLSLFQSTVFNSSILDLSDHNATDDSYNIDPRKTSRTKLMFQKISVTFILYARQIFTSNRKMIGIIFPPKPNYFTNQGHKRQLYTISTRTMGK